MASYELIPFKRFDDVSIIAAIEQQSPIITVGFWVKDHNAHIQWPEVLDTTNKADFLWHKTCFELFIGIKNTDEYREIHLSPAQQWQSYAFEEYRYPDTVPPQVASDIQVTELKRTHYGLSASIDLSTFLAQYQVKCNDLYIALCAVICTNEGKQYYAIQHSSPEPDFHNKRDWLHEL